MNPTALSISVPPLSTPCKYAHAAVITSAIVLIALGALALLASEGVPVGACFADLGATFGGVSIFIGLGAVLAEAVILSRMREKRYFQLQEEGDIQPTQQNFCCLRGARFTHGRDDHRNPLWDTVENISLMPLGGFRRYTPSAEEMAQLHVPEGAHLPPREGKIDIVWMGHACFLIRIGQNDGSEFTILLDPNWEDTIPFLKLGSCQIPLYYRSVPPGYPLDELPDIDCVFYSHTHDDHLNPPTALKLEGKCKPNFYCPMNAASILDGCENVTELTWWESVVLKDSGGVAVTCVPSDHASQTTATDCNAYLWGGYYITIPLKDSDPYHIYFMGDSACNVNPERPGFRPDQWAFDSKVFTDIKKFPQPDLMCLQTDPVWGQEDKHANAWQAVDLVKMVNPKKIIPMHFGTWPWNQFQTDLLAPIRILKEAFREEAPEQFAKIHQLKVGERLSLVDSEEEKVD